MILTVYSFSRASTVMRHKPLSFSGGVFGWFESRLISISEAVHLNVRSRAFAATVHRSNPDSKLLLTLPSGERYIYMKLYVGNLAFQTTSEDLQELFSQAGQVESASIVTDRDTGRSRGFGFVEMASKAEGEAAIAQFNGMEVNGRNLTVNEARPRESRGGGCAFGGGGGA